MHKRVSHISTNDNSVNDRAIVHRAQRGERAAFDALVDLHIEPITHFIYRYFTNIDDIQDMVQEVFTKAFCNLTRFDPSIGAFRSWLFKIASNVSISEINRQKRVRFRDPHEIQIEEEARRTVNNPYEAQSIASLVQTVIQSMPSQDRQVLVLSFYHEMTYQEIADILGIPLGTIKSRMRNAMSRARKELQKLTEGDSK